MEYDYNKYFTEFFGHEPEEDLNSYDRSYDPDDFSDYEEFDDDEFESNRVPTIVTQHVTATNKKIEEYKKLNIKVDKPEIEAILEADTAMMSQIANKFFAMQDSFYDNTDFQQVPSPLLFSSIEKTKLGPLQELFDEEEECAKSELREVRNDIKDENGPLFKTISTLQQVMRDPNDFEADTIFSQQCTEFFQDHQGWNFEKHRLKQFQELKSFDHNKEHIRMILEYQETKPAKQHQLFITYGPSGGGKTTFFKKHKKLLRMFEVDELIRQNYESFECFQKYVEHLGAGHDGIMNLWFKYHLDRYFRDGKLANQLLLFNHPNQMPNYFRKIFNELIILPKQLNWNVRFFNENYFSLASVLGKHKVILDYHSYYDYIIRYFKLNFSSKDLKFIKKLPGYYKTRITKLIYRSSPRNGASMKRKIETVSSNSNKKKVIPFLIEENEVLDKHKTTDGKVDLSLDVTKQKPDK